MLAAAAAVLLVSGLAVNNVSAQPSPPADPAVLDLPAAEPEQAESDDIDETLVDCMAKVVHHEAANQPHEGQVAVAHVMMNRVRAGFAEDVCAVARQPRQFFNIDRYQPNRESKRWEKAVAVARAVLAGDEPDTSQGALYYHANWAQPDRFFRTRTRLLRLEDHDFYR